MKRRITIAPELVEPLQRYGEQFMLTDLTDIVNHLIRHQLVNPAPHDTSPKTIPFAPQTLRSYYKFSIGNRHD